MANVTFTKKEVKEILKNDFTEKYKNLKNRMRTHNTMFSNGVKCTNVEQLALYFIEHEGNYFTLNAEIEREFKSLLND